MPVVAAVGGMMEEMTAVPQNEILTVDVLVVYIRSQLVVARAACWPYLSSSAW